MFVCVRVSVRADRVSPCDSPSSDLRSASECDVSRKSLPGYLIRPRGPNEDTSQTPESDKTEWVLTSVSSRDGRSGQPYRGDGDDRGPTEDPVEQVRGRGVRHPPYTGTRTRCTLGRRTQYLRGLPHTDAQHSQRGELRRRAKVLRGLSRVSGPLLS